MNHIRVKQEKSMYQNGIGFLVLTYGVACYVFKYQTMSVIILELFIALLFLGISITYCVREDFLIKKELRFFGLLFLWWRIKIDYPEYISVFVARYKEKDEFGNTTFIDSKYVVRFFTGTKFFTVIKTYKYQKALDDANMLSKLLDVEIYNAVKE